MSHFLLIDVGSYDASTVYGIYATFDAAREDAENRTAAKDEIERQARANRVPGQLGDPGPYVDSREYGIERAQIEEWDDSMHMQSWERRWSNPLDWRSLMTRREDT
jgi:hypothetical protein